MDKYLGFLYSTSPIIYIFIGMVLMFASLALYREMGSIRLSNIFSTLTLITTYFIYATTGYQNYFFYLICLILVFIPGSLIDARCLNKYNNKNLNVEGSVFSVVSIVIVFSFILSLLITHNTKTDIKDYLIVFAECLAISIVFWAIAFTIPDRITKSEVKSSTAYNCAAFYIISFVLIFIELYKKFIIVHN